VNTEMRLDTHPSTQKNRPAMRRSHPNDAVKNTPVMIAIGAARAALDVSSDM
jgi:hypothetical protein